MRDVKDQAELLGEDPNLLGLGTLLTLCDLELHTLTVFQRLVAVHLDRGEVDENVLSSVDRDEAVALLAVEPLDGALCLCHGALPLLRSCWVVPTPKRRGRVAGVLAPSVTGSWNPARNDDRKARYTRAAGPAQPQIGQQGHELKVSQHAFNALPYDYTCRRDCTTRNRFAT